MKRVLIWDLPTRLFHGLFAIGFSIAALLALGFGEESRFFPYHAIIGLTLALMVIIRVLWGLIGSRYARFRSFLFKPADVAVYLSGVLTGRGGRHAGHNPGSAYAILAMLVVMLGLAITGIMMGTGNESVEEVHELLAYAMLALVGAHILGVIVHTVRYQDNITASMIHGRKTVDEQSGIRSARPVVAAVFLFICVGWIGALIRSYDPGTQSTWLPLVGMRLTLGEAESVEKGVSSEHLQPDDADDD